MRPDPIEILVRHQTAALEAHGVDSNFARTEAEERVAQVLEQLAQLGLKDVYLGVALSRARVYRMRCAGHTVQVICERLGISRTIEYEDYRAELRRRHKTP